MALTNTKHLFLLTFSQVCQRGEYTCRKLRKRCVFWLSNQSQTVITADYYLMAEGEWRWKILKLILCLFWTLLQTTHRCLSKFPQITLLYFLDSSSRELTIEIEQAITMQEQPQISGYLRMICILIAMQAVPWKYHWPRKICSRCEVSQHFLQKSK